MKVTIALLTLTLCGMFLSASAVAGKVYKWVDASGVTHYGEQPPVSGDSETLKTHSALPSDHEKALKELAQTKKKIADDEQSRLKKIADTEEKKKEQEADKTQSGRCDTARDNIQKLQARPRTKETSGTGEVRIISEEERQAKISENQKYLDVYCGNQNGNKKAKKE